MNYIYINMARRQHEALMGTACSTGGTDSATKIVTSNVILQNNVVHPPVGVSFQPSPDTTIYSNVSACRVITGNKEGEHKITFCGSMPEQKNSNEELQHEALSGVFLMQATTNHSAAQEYIKNTASQALNTAREINKIITQNFEATDNATTTIYKTENFQQWLSSAIDRLHDIREFLPASVVRATLYHNFMQDFIQETPTKASKFIGYLSNFFQLAFEDGFWGTYKGQYLSFFEYVRAGGPFIEIDLDYLFPTRSPGSMNDIKHHLMKTQIGQLKTLGIPLVKIVDNDASRGLNNLPLSVQSIDTVDIPDETSDLDIGSISILSHIHPEKLKVLWSEAESMKADDQKFIDIDGITLFLFVDAFKRPMIAHAEAFVTSSKTFIAQVDRANSKIWRGDADQTMNVMRAETRRYLFPEEGGIRNFGFNRVSEDELETTQHAKITYKSSTKVETIIPIIEQSLKNQKNLLDAEVMTAAASTAGGNAVDIMQAVVDVVLTYKPRVDDLLCYSLNDIYNIRMTLVGVGSGTHTMDKSEHLTKSGAATLDWKKDLDKDKSRLQSMATALGIEIPEVGTVNSVSGDLNQKREQILNPLVQDILQKSTDVQKITKVSVHAALQDNKIQSGPATLQAFNHITTCNNFYFVEVMTESDGKLYVKLPNGEKYYAFSFLTSWDENFAKAISVKGLFSRALTLNGSQINQMNSNGSAKEGSTYIALATVMQLEDKILNIIAEKSVVEMMDVTNNQPFLRAIADYVQAQSHSLKFLDKFKGVFLATTAHHETHTFSGINPPTGRLVGFSRHPNFLTGKESTATAAARIFEPANHPPGLLEWSADPNAPSEKERIDRIGGNGSPSLGDRIKQMDPRRIIVSLLVASMTANSEVDKVYKMEEDDMEQQSSSATSSSPSFASYAAPLGYTTGETIFIRLGKTIRVVLAEIMQIEQPAVNVSAVVFDPLFSSMHLRQLYSIKNWLWQQLTSYQSATGMMQILLHVCGNLKDEDNFITDGNFLANAITRSIVLLFEEFKIGFEKDPLPLIQKALVEKGVDKLQKDVVCNAEEINRSWLDWTNAEFGSLSTEDEPDEKSQDSKYDFARGGLDNDESLPLLRSILTSMGNDMDKPEVKLTSSIRLPQSLLAFVPSLPPATSDHAVSVTDVHKKKYHLYTYLFDSLLVEREGKTIKKLEKYIQTLEKTGKDDGRKAVPRSLLIWIFELWQKRMQHDEGVTDDKVKNWQELFVKTVAHAVARRGKTDATGTNDDDDVQSGGVNAKKIDPFTNDEMIGFSRSLDGISDIRKDKDKCQRCLQFCLKSIAYGVTTYHVFNGQVNSDSTQLFLKNLTPDQQAACITYCSQVRQEEGLKSFGDRGPLECSDVTNTCYGNSRLNGIPKSIICGVVSFDKQLTVVGHLQGITSIMLSIKGEILCLGGFRGDTSPTHNTVNLTTDLSLVENLSIGLACTDTYWIGKVDREAKAWGVTEQQYKNIKLLILLIGGVINQLLHTRFVEFFNLVKTQETNHKDGALNVIIQSITMIISNVAISDTIPLLKKLDVEIDKRVKAQKNTIVPVNNVECGIHESAEIWRKVDEQRIFRQACIMFLRACFGEVGTVNNMGDFLQKFINSTDNPRWILQVMSKPQSLPTTLVSGSSLVQSGNPIQHSQQYHIAALAQHHGITPDHLLQYFQQHPQYQQQSGPTIQVLGGSDQPGPTIQVLGGSNQQQTPKPLHLMDSGGSGSGGNVQPQYQIASVKKQARDQAKKQARMQLQTAIGTLNQYLNGVGEWSQYTEASILEQWKTIKEAYTAATRRTALNHKLIEAYNTINRRLLEWGKTHHVDYWGNKLSKGGGARMGTRKRRHRRRRKTRRKKKRRKRKSIKKRRKRGRKTRRK